MSTTQLAPKSRHEQFAEQVAKLDSIPGVQAILQPLLSYLQQPFEQQDVQRIVDLISHDNSLAAQCLHMANSPLFGRWQSIASVRAAVVALGLQRTREIAVSCCMLKLVPPGSKEHNPTVFWEHSLACALLARKMGKRIGMRDPEQLYLAGLLHDLGITVNLRLVPDEFYDLLQRAEAEHRQLDELEQELWACSHCETGGMLAKKWELNPLIVDVIEHHHRPSPSSPKGSISAVVGLCDLICRANGIGYGYREELAIDWNTNDFILAIQEESQLARTLNWPQVGAELTGYLAEVRKLVSVLFRLN